MAARGARSRKVVEKAIRKEEEKQARKENRDTLGGRKTSAGGASTPKPLYPSNVRGNSQDIRRPSALSSGISVRSSESGSSKTASAVDKLSAKISQSAHTAAANRYVGTTGKATAAPRGRVGGVPVKAEPARARQAKLAQLRDRERNASIAETDASSITPTESTAPSLTSPTTDQNWENTRIWVGNGQPTKPYPGFDQEPDLWMNDGNCAIFFHEETDLEEPKATLRIHSAVLERARSAFMSNLLKYGEIVPEEDNSETDGASRADATRTPTWPLSTSSVGSLDQFLSGSGKSTAMGDYQPPPETPEIMPEERAQHGEQRITHEIWFRCPSHIKNKAVQRRHNIATRNFIALLYGLPIIGNDYYEMLSDLQHVLDTYYELNEQHERLNTAAVITQYLVVRKLDDVRNDLSAALGLLAWCEQPDVEWEAGYMEAFVHAVGMMSDETLENPESTRNLNSETRHKLKTAHYALQTKIAEAEDRLELFNFEELWYVDGIEQNQPAQASFETFRQFLHTFYQNEYERWPPAKRNYQSRWLSRDLVQRLQIDFGSLYDYLVDHDIVWEATEERHTRKWMMVSKHPRRGLTFQADRPGLPLTAMLVGFDSSQRHDHIPHPYPLLPEEKPAAPASKPQEGKKSLFSKLKKQSSVKEAPVPDAKIQYQMALAFNGATNSTRVGTHFEDNQLIEEFSNYEKTSVLPNVSPVDARLGRWVLLYGVLETLSTISVDTGGLRYSDGVRYFISPSLDGLPSWRNENTTRTMAEACQQRSYCWLAPKVWTESSRAQQQGGIPKGPVSTPLAAGPSEDTLRQPAPGSQFRMAGPSSQIPQSPNTALRLQAGDPPAYSGPSDLMQSPQVDPQQSPVRRREPHPLQAPYLQHSYLPSAVVSSITTEAIRTAAPQQMGHSVTVSTPHGDFNLNGGRTAGPSAIGLSELDGDAHMGRGGNSSSDDSKGGSGIRRTPSTSLSGLLGRSDRYNREQTQQYESTPRPQQPSLPRKPAEYTEAALARSRETSQQREAIRQLEERRRAEAHLQGHERPPRSSPLQTNVAPAKYSTIPSPVVPSRHEEEKIRQLFADARNPAPLPVPVPLPQSSGGNAFAGHPAAAILSRTPLPGTNAFAAPQERVEGLGLLGMPSVANKSAKRTQEAMGNGAGGKAGVELGLEERK